MDKFLDSLSSSKLYRSLFPFFKDSTTDEVLINSVRSCAVYKSQGELKILDPIYDDEDSLIEDMQYFAYALGVRLDATCPINGGLFHVDNMDIRWHFVLPSVSVGGALLSFRRHRFDSLELDSFIDKSSCKDLGQCIHILESIFNRSHPLIVCGATGTGKTSLLYTCLKRFLSLNRVTIIEKIREFPPVSRGWVHLVERSPNIAGYGGYKIEDIFKEVLRLRPDNIVVGEIRDKNEMKVFFDALQSGHQGVYTTCHAGSPKQLGSRLASLIDQRDVSSVFEDVSVNLCVMQHDRSYQINNIYTYKNGWVSLL